MTHTCTIKLWKVTLERKSKRGRGEYTYVEAETAAAAAKVAEANNPGWVTYGTPKEEETC